VIIQESATLVRGISSINLLVGLYVPPQTLTYLSKTGHFTTQGGSYMISLPLTFVSEEASPAKPFSAHTESDQGGAKQPQLS